MTLKPGPKPHGYRGTRLYRIWSNMIQRCTNPKNKRFASYGGRGITHRGWVWRYERAPEDEMIRIAGKPERVPA